jgi:hypothetical protein
MNFKKGILIGSGIVVTIEIMLIIFSFSQFYDSCYNNLICQDGFLNWISILSPYISLFIPIFVFSIITYFLPEKIFHIWMYVTFCFLLLSTIIITFASDEKGGGFLSEPSPKEFVSLLLPLFFIIISTLIIITKLLTLYLNKKKASALTK